MLLVDIYRHTLPKGLRFDAQSRMLFANLYVVAKRNKHRRYIPRAEIEEVLQGYVYPTPAVVRGARFLPVVRHLLLLRPANSCRHTLGKKLWLINMNVETEYRRTKTWFDREVDRNAKNPKMAEFIERERFQTHVLDTFHVATMYHRGMRVGFACVVLLMAFLVVHAAFESCFYAYLKYWLGLSKEKVMALLRISTLAHFAFATPDGYDGVLPAPAMLLRKGATLPASAVLRDPAGDADASPTPLAGADAGASSGDRIFLTVCEFVSPDTTKSVIVIPMPQAGTRAFFTKVGRLLSACDGILLEGVSQSALAQLPPLMFFPCRFDTFPAVGLQHRYMPLLRDATEPPVLFHGALPPSFFGRARLMSLPFAFRSVYFPSYMASTKLETRNGWGYLREVLEDPSAMFTTTHIDPSKENSGGLKAVQRESFSLAVPWSASQVVSLEASLLKYGYTLASYRYVEWLPLDHMGENFCAYFDYK